MEKEQEELLNLDLSESDDEDVNEDEWVIRRMHSTKLRQVGQWGEYESESGTTFYFSSPKRTGTWQKPAEVEAVDKETDAEEAKEEEGAAETDSKAEEAEAPVLDTTSEPGGGKLQEGQKASVEEAPAIAGPSPRGAQEEVPAAKQKQRSAGAAGSTPEQPAAGA